MKKQFSLLAYFDKILSIRVNFTDERSKICIENKDFVSPFSSRYNFSFLKITRTDKWMPSILKFSGILCFLSILMIGSSFSQTPRENVYLVDSLMKHYEANNRVFGSLTISHKGEVIMNKQYGYSNLKKKKKANKKTKYRIGSISKMYTTVMILQLIENGELSLSTPLSKYYPQIKNSKNITIKNLLNHSSGIFNFTNDTSYISYHTTKQTKEELLKRITDFTPSFKPGEKNNYSNSNYILLSFILEDVTGKSFAKNLKARITKPLKLKNTYYGNKTKSCQNEAFSYQFLSDWEKALETDMSVPIGAGAVVATTKDLTIFIDALFDYKLIKKAHLDSMMTLTNNYGLGMFTFPFYERTAYGHTGGIDGFSSVTSHFTDDDLTIAWSSNGNRLTNISLGILKLLYNKGFEFPVYKNIKLNEDLLKGFSGTYVTDKLPLDITIRTENGLLFAQATDQPEFILEAVNDTTFKFDPARVKIEFIKNETSTHYDLKLLQAGQEFIFNYEAQ